jgi:rod shape-determining protein MreC
VSPLKRYRDAVLIVTMLALPFFVLRANMKRPENLNAVDRVILRVSAAPQFGISSVARGISDLWGQYVYLVDVKSDNDRLAYDNARLRENVHRLERAEVENRELRSSA